jgi:hypothetical protein
MEYDGKSISKQGVVKERWLWPVQNYRE